jgi:hypothetical protein
MRNALHALHAGEHAWFDINQFFLYFTWVAGWEKKERIKSKQNAPTRFEFIELKWVKARSAEPSLAETAYLC